MVWVKRRSVLPQLVEQPYGGLQREVNRLFDDFLSTFDSSPFSKVQQQGVYSPRLTVREDGQKITLEAELPGVDEKDIDISLTNDSITVRGEKKEEREEREGEHQFYSERSYGMFERIIPLQAEIDADKVDARFAKGVLRVILPKAPAAQSRTRKITVRS